MRGRRHSFEEVALENRAQRTTRAKAFRSPQHVRPTHQALLWNGGTSDNKPFLNVWGERDTDKEVTPASMAAETENASQPGAWLYYRQVLETGGHSTGHLVLMEQPERVTDVAVAWWKYWLKGDEEAKAMFVGHGCTFCTSPDEYEFGVNSRFE